MIYLLSFNINISKFLFWAYKLKRKISLSFSYIRTMGCAPSSESRPESRRIGGGYGGYDNGGGWGGGDWGGEGGDGGGCGGGDGGGCGGGDGGGGD